MTKTYFVDSEISLYLVENEKEAKYLSDLFVDELDITGKQITVHGLLPDNLALANFPNGAQLEFLRFRIGPRNHYSFGEIFIRLSNCRLYPMLDS